MLSLPPFVVQIQEIFESVPILRLGCTCETANFITVLINVAFLGLLAYLALKFSSIRADPFFTFLILGGILLIISDILDWWHIIQVAIHRDLIFNYAVDFGVEGLQMVGFSIILIGLIKVWREIS